VGVLENKCSEGSLFQFFTDDFDRKVYIRIALTEMERHGHHFEGKY
jgi:hypothetical protein